MRHRRRRSACVTPECHSAGLRAEARLDPCQELCRQRDFRQQHQGLPPRAQALGDGFKIHFGLARPGHALQQPCAVAAAPLAQGIRRAGLIVGQHRAGAPGVQPREGLVARRGAFFQRARRHQPAHNARAHAGRLRQFARGSPAPPNPSSAAMTRLRASVIRSGSAFAAKQKLARDRPVGQPRHAGGQPQHHGQLRQRVIGQPGQEIAHLCAHRRGIQHADDLAQLGAVEQPFGRPPDHTHHAARPSGTCTKAPSQQPPRARGSPAPGPAVRSVSTPQGVPSS